MRPRSGRAEKGKQMRKRAKNSKKPQKAVDM
jgi:hypothetical protein